MSPALEERPFGKTGERVTVLGLGGGYLDKYSLADGVATVRRALEAGINYFDTSPSYGRGASQVILGKALEGYKEPYMLATKLGYLGTPSAFRSPDALRAQLWENLRALRRSKVDVLQVHEADWHCWWSDEAQHEELVRPNYSYDFDDAAILEVLREAKAQGLCRFIGITGNNAEELSTVLRCVDVDSCLVAYNHNLLFRRAQQTVLPLAQKKGVAYVAAGILFGGSFTRVHPEWLVAPPLWVAPEVRGRLARLYGLQKASGLSLVNMSVRYLVGDSAISTILVGAASPVELEECVAAAQQGPLPPDLHQSIEELGVELELQDFL